MIVPVAKPADAFFQEMVQRAPDAFILVDAKRNILFFNDFAEKLYGWRSDEIVGRPIHLLVPERFRPLLDGMDTSQVKPGGRLGAGLELTALRKDGSEFPVEINMMPLAMENGLHVASVVRDVTKRREIEERLVASEAKFRRVVEALGGSYFFATIEPDGVVSYVSPSVEAILGYTSQEIGRSLEAFLSDHPMNARAGEILAQERAGVRPPPYDLELRHKDGSTRIIECSDTPVIGPDGGTIAIESINRDVTWVRAAEREIREANERTDRLLRRILPDPVVEELTREGSARPMRHRDVSILFCDLAGFTAWCDSRAPEEVVDGLSRLIECFEEVVERHGLQKIKTIGDAFMATGGLLDPLSNPVEAAVRCGFDLLAAGSNASPPWEVRVGVHVGDVVAGIMGRRQFSYDLWGDSVNTAARMERLARDGCIAVSAEAWRAIEGRFSATSLGPVPVKGKGELEVFLVEPP